MKIDAEWEVLGKEWREQSSPLPELRARVERESRSMRWMLASELLVTLVMGGGATLWAILSHDADIAALAGAVWIFIAIALAFGWAIRSGNWSPAANDTASFLDLSIRRCRVSAATAYFGIALCVLELVFCDVWIYRYLAKTGPLAVSAFLASWRIIPSVVALAAVVAASLWYIRKRRRELADLLELQRQLGDVA